MGAATRRRSTATLTDRMDETTLAIAELAARIEAAASAEHVAELRGASPSLAPQVSTKR